ncbi:MAG: V-type ATP synthase subunit F [Oscillospiraceae bacterium]|jgi:V/A-type H+-transporting ATPase subunit F|nr:V-type ATP synthase subunit F [Oscillospiraceae bacterium]
MALDVMGVVGERDAVLAFKAMGMRVIPAETPDAIAAAVFRLAEDGVPVIFITERAAQLSPESLERYKTSASTVLIPIPGSQGTDGFGMRRVKANVEKAIGADILFEK